MKCKNTIPPFKRSGQSILVKFTHGRMHIKYNGNVQGVGFRWNVFELSKSYSVTGYVKNLASGEVELLVEGKKLRFLIL